MVVEAGRMWTVYTTIMSLTHFLALLVIVAILDFTRTRHISHNEPHLAPTVASTSKGT